MGWTKTAKPPRQVGEFEVFEKIAEGATAAVYKGRHRATGQWVAIKLASAETAESPVMRKRFEQEFHITHDLDHPNLVRALRLGQVGGTPYIVLELVEGPTLGERIQREGRLPEAEAVAVITQVAGALEAAHRQGIIHRDIKPDNVLLAPEGVAKLTDLGLAKDFEAELGLTRPSTGLGTPNFMAPEQFRDAKHADARCDIYGLGATLYMAVTGQLPFKARHPVDVFQKKMRNDLAPPRQLVPALSPGLERVILRALDVNPLRRYTTCQAFLNDLNRAGGAEAPAAEAPPRVAPVARGGRREEQRAKVRFPSKQGGFCNPVGAAKVPNWPARIQDISADGVALLLGRRFEPRTSLWVELPGADGGPARHYLVRVVRAQARSARKWLVGCVFARRLSDDEVETLR